MNREDSPGWIRRELVRGEIDPAPESFYSSVWTRIRAVESTSDPMLPDHTFISLGRICWKMAPALAGLLLLLSLYIWYSPLLVPPKAIDSTESLVIETEDIPSKDSVLYQIMDATPASELDTKQ